MSSIKELFGINFNRLYEAIAVTLTKLEKEKIIIPNSACMGVKFLDNNTFQMTPYLETDTYKNLIKFPYVSINFVDKINFYAQAALLGENSGLTEREFPDSSYDFKDEIPYLKESWGVIFGELDEHKIITKATHLGENNVLQANFKIIDFIKIRESFHLKNRAENLALESIILATRLKIAVKKENKEMYEKIYDKILYYNEQIKHFAKNDKVIETMDFIVSYIEKNIKFN
ncbi:hypothetical protein ES703_57951 [subsurface metagenome]